VTHQVTLALDAMGGDEAPVMVVKGAEHFLQTGGKAHFLFFGDETLIKPLLDSCPLVRNSCEIIHTTEMIAADDKPSLALRRGKNSSMRLAIEAVKSKRADAVVSAGNTGALMAMSKVVLRMLDGINRPAIAGIFPNKTHDRLMLDLGANVECDARDLCDFAIMGYAYARTVMGITDPSIGLLNIGVEEMKGHEEIREAASLLKTMPGLRFTGFVEANSILSGDTDVIVADGFSGNIALKAMEGTAQFMYKLLKNSIKSSPLGVLGYFIAQKSFVPVRIKMDQRRYNGGMFLGLNGVVVKSHGGASTVAFAHAITEAHRVVERRVNERIIEEITRLMPELKISPAADKTAAPATTTLSPSDSDTVSA
jgi:glycerol-3-phosphate acyltransferase PlsX